MSDEAQFQEGQRRLQALQGRMEALQSGIQELRRAEATLVGLEEVEVDHPTLVPIGGGIMVPATLQATHVVRPLGADYAAESSIPDALAALRKDLDDASQAYAKAREEAESVTQHLQAMMAQMQDQE